MVSAKQSMTTTANAQGSFSTIFNFRVIHVHDKMRPLLKNDYHCTCLKFFLNVPFFKKYKPNYPIKQLSFAFFPWILGLCLLILFLHLQATSQSIFLTEHRARPSQPPPWWNHPVKAVWRALLCTQSLEHPIYSSDFYWIGQKIHSGFSVTSYGKT